MQTSSATSLGRRDALNNDAELVARLVVEGFEFAHDAVAAIHGVLQLVATIAEALMHLAARPGDHVVDLRNCVRVAQTNHADMALPDFTGAFPFHLPDRGGTN